MKVFGFHTRYQGGTSHLDSVRNRADAALERQQITALPLVRFEEVISPLNYWRLAIEFPDADLPFWAGFLAGIDFVRNNRELMIAPE